MSEIELVRDLFTIMASDTSAQTRTKNSTRAPTPSNTGTHLYCHRDGPKAKTTAEYKPERNVGRPQQDVLTSMLHVSMLD